LLDDNLQRYVFVGTKRIRNLHWKLQKLVSKVDFKGIINIGFQSISLSLKMFPYSMDAVGSSTVTVFILRFMQQLIFLLFPIRTSLYSYRESALKCFPYGSLGQLRLIDDILNNLVYQDLGFVLL
jgi:hypothetical protein